MLFLNDKPVERGTFPNQETYLKTEHLTGRGRIDNLIVNGNTIKMIFEDNNDLIDLMMLKRYLDDIGCTNTHLYAPYFPYSTMDHTDGTKPLALKYVAELINGLNFSTVRSLEPHSMVLSALVDRFHSSYMSINVLYDALAHLKGVVPSSMTMPEDSNGRIFVCFPDEGAQKRYMDRLRGDTPRLAIFSGEHPFEKEFVCFTKRRDFDTGRILNMRCIDEMPAFTENDVCIILDDLCRAGRTFTECANLLKGNGCGTVCLAVTHLERICTKNVLTPVSPVDMIYATNSCLPHGYDDLESPAYPDFQPNTKLHLRKV